MAALNPRARLALTLIPIEGAFGGLIVSALIFPAQTIPQIIGICLGWPVGFWVRQKVRHSFTSGFPRRNETEGEK